MGKQLYESTFESLQRFQCPDWFRDAKFGIWSHWGPQSVPMCGDWYAKRMYEQGSPQYNYHVRTYGHPSKFGYKDICQLWKAEKFDKGFLMMEMILPMSFFIMQIKSTLQRKMYLGIPQIKSSSSIGLV